MTRSAMLSPIVFLLLAVLAAAAAQDHSATSASHPDASGSSPTAAPATTPAKASSPARAPQNPAGEGDLQSVLATMNAKAPSFKSAQAAFEFETYQRVVDEKELQKGRIFFRRAGRSVDAAFDITSPAAKKVVYKDGKIRIFEPRIDQVTEREVGKNKSDVEAFLSLGFGASGTDLQKSYGVALAGWETVDGIKTAKLDLTPKEEKVRNTYDKIILWIDLGRDVLLKQQFIEKSGDYRLARYTSIRLNGNSKVSDDDFRIKTTGSTRTVKAQ